MLLRVAAAAFVVVAASSCDVCPNGGSSTVTVNFLDVPDGGSPRLVLSNTGGTFEFTPSTATQNVGGGAYEVSGNSFALPPRPMPAQLVREAWAWVSTGSSVCISGASASNSTTLDVRWAQIPSSNKLFVAEQNGTHGSPLGYASGILEQMQQNIVNPPGVEGESPVAGDMAFDRAGNLWALAAPGAGGTVQRIPASQLGYSNTPVTKVADRTVELPGNSCAPDFVALAFDRTGNLWVASQCASKVFQIAAADLNNAVVTPRATLSRELTAPHALAFDAAGNLWVADELRILRFDAATLGSSDVIPTRTLRLKVSSDPMNADLHSIGSLAFDRDGALWTHDFGLNRLLRVAPTSLAGSGAASVEPAARIELEVLALVEGLAFDEAGGLWAAGANGAFRRFSAAQLATSTQPGQPAMSDKLIATYPGSVTSIATFPAPSWSPLFANLP
ncbi:MAG: hypothetical protein QM817_29650 [Archangium sp.]